MRQAPYSFDNPPPKRFKPAVLLAIVIGVAALLTVLAALADPGDQETVFTATFEPAQAEPTAVVSSTEQPQQPMPTNSPSGSGEYAAIREAYANRSPADWAAYARLLVGQGVAWQGTLTAVRSDREWWLNIKAPGSDGIPQAVLHFDDPVTAPPAGTQVAFAGQISRIVIYEKQVLVHIEHTRIRQDGE